jgi:hypothetical protein
MAVNSAAVATGPRPPRRVRPLKRPSRGIRHGIIGPHKDVGGAVPGKANGAEALPRM